MGANDAPDRKGSAHVYVINETFNPTDQVFFKRIRATHTTRVTAGKGG